jgi:hypothetical protein
MTIKSASDSDHQRKRGGRLQPGKSRTRSNGAERLAERHLASNLAPRSRTRRYWLLSVMVVVGVITSVAILRFAGVGGGTNVVSEQPSPSAGKLDPRLALTRMASVPLSTLVHAPTDGLLTSLQTVDGSSLTANNKPELLFISTEPCPSCAAERWPLYVALSKFGTFTVQPDPVDSAGQGNSVPTLSFSGATYESPYLSFVSVGNIATTSSATSDRPHQTLNPAEQTLWYSVNGGSVPFLAFGGTHVIPIAQYSYEPLQGISFYAVASEIGRNSTTIGADIDASAGQLIESICTSLSDNQPAAVCSSVSQ